jgi:hypothetical protein
MIFIMDACCPRERKAEAVNGNLERENSVKKIFDTSIICSQSFTSSLSQRIRDQINLTSQRIQGHINLQTRMMTSNAFTILRSPHSVPILPPSIPPKQAFLDYRNSQPHSRPRPLCDAAPFFRMVHRWSTGNPMDAAIHPHRLTTSSNALPGPKTRRHGLGLHHYDVIRINTHHTLVDTSHSNSLRDPHTHIHNPIFYMAERSRSKRMKNYPHKANDGSCTKCGGLELRTTSRNIRARIVSPELSTMQYFNP